jgi:hypothetical protein
VSVQNLRTRRNAARRLAAVSLALILPLVSYAASDAHVVSPREWREELVSQSRLRQQRIAQLNELFSSPIGKKALGAAKLEIGQVAHAAASLDDEELARLSARAAKVQADVTAGALSNEQLTYIVIALATAVFILVIIAASD